jgi:uncharacterized protein YndB with AHSA1/START domain
MSKTVNVTTPTDRELVITRVFEAPREHVFRAMSEPALLQCWLAGPPGWTTTACESDLRPGGQFRHAWRSADGTEMAMRGTYQEVSAPERIIRTESFEFGCQPQAGEQLATLTLTQQGNQTHLSITVLYPTKEARDATLASGMEQGLNASYNTLDKILPTLT